MNLDTLEIACAIARFAERTDAGGCSRQALEAAVCTLGSFYPQLQRSDVARTMFVATALHLTDLPRC